jgi:putative FmdB family regulatory protein
MPTYEYRCPKGHLFELFQKMSEEPRAHCPECGAESERLLSAGAGFLFKGDGFYITDNRNASYEQEASQESSPGTTAAAEQDGGERSDSASPAKPTPPESGSGPEPSSGAAADGP